jgi:sugar-specific transcriptional regulator TrmB
MTTVPPSELLEAKLDKAKDELKEWDDKLEKAQALLLKGMEMKSDRLMELAEERIATAKKAIAQADEDIDMYRKAVVAPHTAAVNAGW